MPEREYNCEACRDTGHKVLDNGSLSDFLDCVNCTIATERAQLNKFVAAINGQPLEDIAWQLVRTTQRTERSIAAAQKAGLKEQLRVAQAALSQDSATPQDNVPGVSELPPLPEAWITDMTTKDPAARYHFTADQMHEYARAALRAYGQRAAVPVMDGKRKQFETWAKSNGYCVDMKGNQKAYPSANTQSAWEVWQAAIDTQYSVPGISKNIAEGGKDA